MFGNPASIYPSITGISHRNSILVRARVPNFIDRSIWGIKSTDNFGYITGALPNITVATSTTTSISVKVPCTGWSTTGKFLGNGTAGRLLVASGSTEQSETLESVKQAGIDRVATVTQGAKSTSTAKYDNNIVRPTSVSVKVKTRFK